MTKLLFKLLYRILWLVTLLPINALVSLSYVFFPFVYYLFPYRKKTVKRNLKNSFPEMEKKELRRICRKFYFHFCVSFLESLYSGILSKEDFLKRYRLKNPEILSSLYKKGKSISLMMAHYGNWEWSVSLQLHTRHQCLPIYKPLHNPYVDSQVKKSRERFGIITVPQEKILRTLISYEEAGIPTITYFLADQRPLMARIQYWTKFLNQDTPVVMGPEKIAHRFNHAVLFLKVIPVKKAVYEIELVPIFEDLKNVAEYQIIEKYHALLESMIREKPEYWLWTHNRWKHKIENYYKLRNREKP